MATGLFISEQFIKDNTIIDGNVDDKYITNTIADSQKLRILPIIGTGLFNEISSQIVAGNVTALNRTLLDDYIQDALKYWVLYDGLDIFHYKVTNKAVMKKNSDDSQPVETIDIVRLKDSFKDKAEYFSQLITKYLLANLTSYPLFTNPGTGIDTVHPNRDNYDTGWNLGTQKNTYGLEVDRGRLNNIDL